MMCRSSCWLRGADRRRRRWQVLVGVVNMVKEVSIELHFIKSKGTQLLVSRNTLTVGWLVGLVVGDIEGDCEQRAK